MTISSDAYDLLTEFDIDRDDVLLVSKGIAQKIIEDSQASDTPLSGLVYDVWGLYNDGMPKCRWTAPYEGTDVVFSGQFRVDGTDAFVVRREVMSATDVADRAAAIRQERSGVA